MINFKLSALLLWCLSFVVLIQSGQSFRSKRARHHTACSSHGHIVNSHCVCNRGYTGTQCEKLDCQHGGTYDSRSLKCVCHNDYYGILCEHKELYCQHGGSFSTHTHKCYCRPDYSGSLCEIVSPSLLCNSHQCIYGHCFHDNSNYFCACYHGYTGRHCSQRVVTNPPPTTPKDLCLGVTCQHGGHCYHDNRNYYCRCANGYTGKHCETKIVITAAVPTTTKITPCTSNPCLNEGHCYDDNVTYICTCRAGFAGMNCEIASTTTQDNLQPLTFGPIIGGITPDPDTTSNMLRTTTPAPQTTISVSTTTAPTTTISATTTPGYPKCNHAHVVAGLFTGRADHPDARPCPENALGDKKSDAIAMQFCGAPNVTSWKKGIQVLENCNSIPKYTPIAQWHNGYVTSKTGVFLSCTNADSFQYFTQTCDVSYKLTNMTWPESESFHVIGY